jgi:hypothetical protein
VTPDRSSFCDVQRFSHSSLKVGSYQKADRWSPELPHAESHRYSSFGTGNFSPSSMPEALLLGWLCTEQGKQPFQNAIGGQPRPYGLPALKME